MRNRLGRSEQLKVSVLSVILCLMEYSFYLSFIAQPLELEQVTDQSL